MSPLHNKKGEWDLCDVEQKGGPVCHIQLNFAVLCWTVNFNGCDKENRTVWSRIRLLKD